MTAAPSLSDVESIFEALAHPSRRQIVILLAQRGGELPSGYLAAHFSHSWPTTTRHLHVLEQAGLVEVRREGRSSNYRLDRTRLAAVVGGWLRHLEPATPDKKWVSTGPKSTSELVAKHQAKGKKGWTPKSSASPSKSRASTKRPISTRSSSTTRGSGTPARATTSTAAG